jgi:hypothetical protein
MFIRYVNHLSGDKESTAYQNMYYPVMEPIKRVINVHIYVHADLNLNLEST